MKQVEIKVRGDHISSPIVLAVCSQIQGAAYRIGYEELYDRIGDVTIGWYSPYTRPPMTGVIGGIHDYKHTG